MSESRIRITPSGRCPGRRRGRRRPVREAAQPQQGHVLGLEVVGVRVGPPRTAVTMVIRSKISPLGRVRPPVSGVRADDGPRRPDQASGRQPGTRNVTSSLPLETDGGGGWTEQVASPHPLDQDRPSRRATRPTSAVAVREDGEAATLAPRAVHEQELGLHLDDDLPRPGPAPEMPADPPGQALEAGPRPRRGDPRPSLLSPR